MKEDGAFIRSIPSALHIIMAIISRAAGTAFVYGQCRAQRAGDSDRTTWSAESGRISISDCTGVTL